MPNVVIIIPSYWHQAVILVCIIIFCNYTYLPKEKQTAMIYLSPYGLSPYEKPPLLKLLCISGIIPRLSLVQHTLYGGVLVSGWAKLLPQHSQGSIVRKDGAEIYHEGGQWQSVLRPQGVLTSPFILKNSLSYIDLLVVCVCS